MATAVYNTRNENLIPVIIPADLYVAYRDSFPVPSSLGSVEAHSGSEAFAKANKLFSGSVSFVQKVQV